MEIQDSKATADNIGDALLDASVAQIRICPAEPQLF